MKIWLNDLKEGDIFYHILLDKVYKCEHLGDAHNTNFKMSRIKFKILDIDVNNVNISDECLFTDIQEAFVNQYVYDDYESAKEDCINNIGININNIKNKISDLEKTIEEYKLTIKNLEKNKQKLENIIKTN